MKFAATHRVEFRDTDAAGIMHFSTFLTYMEETEHELLRSVGLSVLNCEADGLRISWPRVSVQCDFRSPVRFEELFEVHASIGKLGSKSIQYCFEFQKEEKVFAVGSITAVCCQMEKDSMTAISIPESIRTKLAPFVEAQE